MIAFQRPKTNPHPFLRLGPRIVDLGWNTRQDSSLESMIQEHVEKILKYVRTTKKGTYIHLYTRNVDKVAHT